MEEPDRAEQKVPARRGRPRRWPPTLATVVGSAFGVWGLLIGLRRLSDNSLFTHIATGRLLVDGVFPRADPYSFTARGEPWVVQSWLVSYAYGWLDSWFGAGGIRLLTGVLCAAIAWVAWLLTRPAESLLARIVIGGLVLAVGSQLWSPRPLLVGLLLLAVTLLAAEGRFPAPALLPLFWVWANAHGSFPLGLLALGAFALGRRLDGERPEVELRCLGWAAGGALAGVIGPLGLQALRFPLDLLGRQSQLQAVVEWQSPSFTDLWSRLFLVQLAVAVIALVRAPRFRAAVPLVVFVAAALFATRNLAVASLVLVPGMAMGLRGLGSLRGDERTPFTAVAAAALLVSAAVVTVGALGEPDYDLSTYPVDAVAWLDQQGVLGDGRTRVLTTETTGNYLELLEGADAAVFLDDRIDMYPADVVEDFLVVLRGRPGWSDVLERRGVDVVLWDRAEPLSQLLAESPAWRVVYGDERSVVACRAGSEACGRLTGGQAG